MQREIELANKLRYEQCYDNGEEIEPKESAKTLHQLGLVYKEKSPDKISLIQSVALMTSAVLRKPDNADEIKKDLDDVCMHIMTLADAANPDAKLIEKAVTETKKRLEILRENTKDKLSELKTMSDDLKGAKLDNVRKQRVKQVRNIQDYVTKTFRNVMNFIATETVYIMGKPPCKFALVGMGSLAKKEVTPYSDFESIIVLERGIQKNEKYNIFLNYFRWFATVYQLILVRLGETLLRFLVIPCLNNPLNKKEDWFYDAYTPCGISPDGFAPQASKNPLGNTAIELIKPVSEMVKYLETEEDLKNGYHLADMLTTTCFVFGSFAVYKEFDLKTKQKINHIPIFNPRVQKNIKKDYELYEVGSQDLHNKIDIKRVALRSCTLFVLALGRLYECKNLSCFDILDELSDRGLTDEMLHIKTQFSLAVAYEIRLRWYNKSSSHSDIVHEDMEIGGLSSMEKVSKDIGSRAVVDGLNMTESLQQYVVLSFIEQRKQKIRFSESPFRAVVLAWTFHLFRFAIELIEECRDLKECKKERVLVQLFYARCLFQCGEYEKSLKVCKDELTRLTQPFLLDSRGEFLQQCHRCLFHLERYKEALECTKLLSEYSSRGMRSVPKIEINADMAKYYHNLHNKKALKYFKCAYNQAKKELPQTLRWHVYNQLMLDYSTCLNETGCYYKAISVNNEWISEIRKTHVDEETDVFINLGFLLKGYSLCGLKKYEDALVYLNKSRNVTKNRNESLLTGKFVSPKLECLTKLGRLAEAESFLKNIWHERMEHIRLAFQAELPRAEYTGYCCLIYYLISARRFEDKQFNDAICFAKKAIHLGSLNSIKIFLETIGLLFVILLDLQRFDECYAAAKHGLKLWQFACENYWVEEKFVSLAIVYSVCEWRLGIKSPTLPCDCTPSVFYHAGKFWRGNMKFVI